MTNSKNVSVTTENNTDSAKNDVEQIEALSAIHLPVDHLLAALSCASTEETRYYLNGIHIHRHEDTIRAVATDGHRLFVASTKIADDFEVPGWVKEGVTIHSENLGVKLKLAAKLSNDESPFIKIAFGKGQPNVIVSDPTDEATFRCHPVDGAFPDYLRLMSSITGGVTVDTDTQRGDFEPVNFNATYLKAVGDVSKILTGKDGQVSIFANTATEASFITFPAAPGCLMLLMPVKVVQAVAPATAALMAPAIKGTVAALRAHMTRNQEAAEAEKDPTEKARLLDKAAEYEQRIAAVMNRTLEQPAIEGPKDEAKAEDAQIIDAEPAKDDKAADAKAQPKAEAKKVDATPAKGKADAPKADAKAQTATKADAKPATTEKPKDQPKEAYKAAPKAETKADPKGKATSKQDAKAEAPKVEKTETKANAKPQNEAKQAA